VPELLGTNVPHEVGGRVRVAVGVAVEASHPAARPLGAPVLGLVELLLGEGRQQQAKPLDLLRVQDPVEELVEVVEGDLLALGDVPQVRTRGEEDGGRELRQQVVRQVEVEVEPREVPRLLPLDLVDVELGEQHPALGMVGMRQGQEAAGKRVLVPDLVRAHGREPLPRPALGQARPHAVLDGLALGHGHAAGRAVGEVVTLPEKVGLPFHDLGFRGLHAGHDGGEILLDVHGGIAGWLGGLVLGPNQAGAGKGEDYGAPGEEAKGPSHGDTSVEERTPGPGIYSRRELEFEEPCSSSRAMRRAMKNVGSPSAKRGQHQRVFHRPSEL
jgi:hypothetical protein